MVEDRTTDGKRIAQLLSSEVSSREDSGLDGLAVVNADADVEPSADGELAYEVALRDDVFVRLGGRFGRSRCGKDRLDKGGNRSFAA